MRPIARQVIAQWLGRMLGKPAAPPPGSGGASPAPGARGDDPAFQALLDSTHEGIYGLDAAGRCTFINRAAAAMLGYTPETLIGRDLHEVHHRAREDGTPYPREDCPIHRTIRTGEGCHVEEEVFWRRDGSYFPVSYSAHPIRRDGLVIGAIVVFSDITARRWMETTLRESESRFKSAFDQTAVGMTLAEPSGRLLRANPAFCAMLGYPPGELDGRTWQELTHPGDLDENLREFRRMLAGEIPALHLEKRYLHRDGDVVWGLIAATPVRDAGGALLYCVCHILDITERKRAELALEESERRFAAFMNNTTVLAWMKDVRFRYVYVNEAFDALLGLPHDRIIGREDFEVFPEAVARAVRRNDEQVLRSWQPLETHEVGPNRHGESRNWWVYKFPFRDADGRAFVGGIAFDVTERDRIEQALRDRERDLLRLLDERQALVENLHDGVIQEIYAIGLGLMETRRMVWADPGAAQRRVGDAIAELNLVIGELRAYLAGSPSEAVTGDRFASVLSTYINAWDSQNTVRFKLDVDPTASSRLTAEQATHLLYIARELISNSVRHSHGREGLVSLRRDRQAIRLTVQDDGVGLAPETAEAGEGLGLRNLRARARKLGATVDLLSQPGRGTAITVTIPMPAADSAPDQGR